MKNFILPIAFAVILFRFLLSKDPLIANDWPLLFRESRAFSPFWTMAWDYMGNGGIGGPAFKTLWIDLYANFVYFVTDLLNIPWWLSQRIFWVMPFISVSIFSSYKFSGYFLKNNLSKIISVLIYSFNTYILMILGGGQFGVAFSYALAPLALVTFFKLLDKPTLQNSLMSGLLWGILIALDPRIASLSFLIGFIWLIFFGKLSWVKSKYIFLSLVIACALNSYWILPVFMSLGSVSGFSNYTSLAGVKFLSFATLADSISLLHPNFPENIFGKIYFFKPLFLVFPILAFATLLLKPKKKIIFFLGVALLSVFLAKGASDPFGQIYLFLFDNIPGFNLFRDSTKFYVLIALSYSILIPYFIESVPFRLRQFIVGVFIILFLVVLKPVWTGEITGIFNPKPIPENYSLFKEKLVSDKSFYRTMWVPQRQKFGYFNPNHPAMDGKSVLGAKSLNDLLSKLSKEDTREMLSDLSVRYLIVPEDTDGEIFLKDRRYDGYQHKKTVDFLSKMSWLKRVGGFGALAVYENTDYRNHFFSPTDVVVEGQFVNPSEYKIVVDGSKDGELIVFSEGFDRGWRMGGAEPRPYKARLNSFIVSGGKDLKVYYEPQAWVNRGLLISAATFVGVISLMVFGRLRRKW